MHRGRKQPQLWRRATLFGPALQRGQYQAALYKDINLDLRCLTYELGGSSLEANLKCTLHHPSLPLFLLLHHFTPAAPPESTEGWR